MARPLREELFFAVSLKRSNNKLIFFFFSFFLLGGDLTGGLIKPHKDLSELIKIADTVLECKVKKLKDIFSEKKYFSKTDYINSSFRTAPITDW